MKAVHITERHFIEDDVVDGLIDYTRTEEYSWRCEDTIPGPSQDFDTQYAWEEAIHHLKRHGLTFDGSSDYFTDPDGSYIADYATGRRVETTGAFVGEWTAGEKSRIIAQVNRRG